MKRRSVRGTVLLDSFTVTPLVRFLCLSAFEHVGAREFKDQTLAGATELACVGVVGGCRESRRGGPRRTRRRRSTNAVAEQVD